MDKHKLKVKEIDLTITLHAMGELEDVNELDKVTDGFVCTPELIKSLDWEFTGSCSENPYPFDVDFYYFHHWLLTAFK